MQVWRFSLCMEATGRFPAISDRVGFAFKGITLDGDWTLELKTESAGGLEQMGREACDAVLTELEPCFCTLYLTRVTWG